MKFSDGNSGPKFCTDFQPWNLWYPGTQNTSPKRCSVEEYTEQPGWAFGQWAIEHKNYFMESE